MTLGRTIDGLKNGFIKKAHRTGWLASQAEDWEAVQ